MFHGRVIACDAVVAPLPVNVPDAVKTWIIAMVDFAYDAAIGLPLVGHDCRESVKTHALNRVVQKGFGSFRI